MAIVHNIFIDRLRSRRSEAARIEQAGRLADQSVAASQDHSVHLSQVREAFLALPEEQRSALNFINIFHLLNFTGERE